MRIISGKYKGMKLAEFAGDDIRPTADRVKESLFNILGQRVVGARVLDLFCGSGNLGIECLSRGAARVVFNDISKDSVAVLTKNLKKLKDATGCYVHNLDYAQCLARGEVFDLIFIDPPYRLDVGLRALEKIGSAHLLADGGVAVYERDRAFVGEADGLEMYDERRYGKTYLTLFRRA